ncbi:hypothetical protein EDB92DRAFT_1819775 [Lactarius akahatsu]|uniref:Uncharacterized protein n=1 Tax=Lactarius akahatsu TaxID=416441 RepID=A0AAD4LAR7_9AGAM|nr:hypothetical protein EDB92DRAFT_1819775 [Lactarius akahatsu]
MGFMGKIDLVSPEIPMGCFEEYRDIHGTTRQKHEGAAGFREAFFGRLLEQGSARSLIKMFDVKKRQYFGNTSMEAEISLLMANQTLALVALPTQLLTSVHSYSDQTSMADRCGEKVRRHQGYCALRLNMGFDNGLDLCTFDITRNPWRCGGLFDAIITDPPYGVRAGAKRLGRKRERAANSSAPSQPGAHTSSPPSRPTSLFLRGTFLPTVIDKYKELDLDSMLCDGMEVVANSLRDFGAWGRRLITIRRSTSVAYPPPTFDSQAAHGGSGSSGNDHDGEDASPASPVHAHVPRPPGFSREILPVLQNQEAIVRGVGT